MLYLVGNAKRREEKSYLALVLSDFLGVYVEFQSADIRGFEIRDRDGRAKICLPDTLLAFSDTQFLSYKSLPQLPLASFTPSDHGLEPILAEKSVPIIYGPPAGVYIEAQVSRDVITIPFDLLGSIFFMLTRYEELVSTDRDHHQRFPANASLGYKANFLMRPIVNEYVEILWSAVKLLWPQLERKERVFETHVSHDVDRPALYAGSSFARCLRSYLGEIRRRKDPLWAVQRVIEICKIRTAKAPDPFDTFSWLMDQSEEFNLNSHFYFKAGARTSYDSGYSLESAYIKSKMSEINQRGHKIGFHPGYYTFDSQTEWQKQFDLLSDVCPQVVDSGRQHYLRFKVPTTWRFWESSGCRLDLSMGYADHVGFRTGACFEHPVFDLEKRQTLKVRELPLIVMDGTLSSAGYMGLKGAEDIFNVANGLKQRVKIFNGTYTLLWHNSSLLTQEDREIYRALLT